MRGDRVGRRRVVALGVVAAAAWAAWYLDLRPGDAIPRGEHWVVLRDFFAEAVHPVLTATLRAELLRGLWNTVVFAASAMALALPLGIVLGFFASTAWWATDSGGDGARPTAARCVVCRLVFVAARSAIALFRSVHELLWAVLLLCALGNSPLSGVFAIAIPYGCTLGKVFAEVVDEVPREAAWALRGLGAAPLQVFCFGLLPRALADVTAYAFYRFECALRSAAVLGFFGFETIGYFLQQAFQTGSYGEAWTHLYALLALVGLFDWWSGALRRSFAR
ncbi:MAG: ABC transporter permease subunit [Planctomycetes bacterium]|nr:ABC transporter permease subunit [Planctomycetota bacterium]MCB9887929.1 ABC transporter permease subunit [Planctomycetota bacterium]